jgi:hypothetical protein
MKPMSLFAAIVLLLVFTVSARAQDEPAVATSLVPRVQISAGYSVVHDLDSHRSIPGGWFISADKNVNERLGVTYELSASGTVTHHLAYLPGYVTHWSTGGLLLGPTFSNRDHDRFVLFSRLLGGIASAGSSDDGYAVALAIQPGVGLDLNFNRHLGIRSTVDYRSLFGIGTASGGRASQLWLRTGIVVSFGKR